MLKILSICATASFLFVSSAMAQSGVGACRADIKKVCGDIKPGGSRIATCLKERVADLSDVCKARLAGVAAARKTCNGEIEKPMRYQRSHSESGLHQECPHQSRR